MEARTKQVNIRVTPGVYRVLKAAALAQGGGLQRLLTPVVEQTANELRGDRLVRDFMKDLTATDRRAGKAPQKPGKGTRRGPR